MAGVAVVTAWFAPTVSKLLHSRLPDANVQPGAGLAQLVEHLICNQGVTGSNPVTGTNDFKGLTGKIGQISCPFSVDFRYPFPSRFPIGAFQDGS